LFEQSVLCALLAAGTAVPHARGPLLTLVLTVVVVGFARRSRQALATVAAVAVGVALGLLVAATVSTGLTLLGTPTGAAGPGGGETSTPISSFSIRKQWMRQAVRQAPDRPVFGHGIGMFVDRTPEAGRMGVAGQRVYPHNDIVESAYSLGAIGFVLFIAFLAIPVFVLVTRRGARAEPLHVFAVGLFAFAFLESNFSGEIGTDVVLWSSAAIIVLVLFGRRVRTQRD
jgi:O-antigen ligase